MCQPPGWQASARWTAALVLADSGLNGLFERLVTATATGAAAIAALAVGILRRSRT